MKIFVFTISLFFIVIVGLLAEENPWGYYPNDFVIVDSVSVNEKNDCMECYNENLCIIGIENGFNYFKISTDGGITWKKLELEDKLETNIVFWDIEFIDSGWFIAAGTGGYIIHVFDELKKVDIRRIEEITNRIHKIDINENGFGMCRGNGKLFYTEDYGKTWAKFELNPGDYGMSGIFGFEITDNYLYVQLSNEEISNGFIYRDLKLLRTSDMGENWAVYDIPEYAMFMQFVNDSTGWACGNVRTDMVGVYGKAVYKISSYGENIQQILDATYLETFSSSIYGINFDNEFEGYFYGSHGIIYTSDGGKNWINVYDNPEGWPPNTPIMGLETFPGNKMIFVEYNYTFANLNATHIEIAKQDSTLSLHPNPATEHIFIDTELLHSTIEIYNLLGIKAAEQAVTSGREKIDVSGLPAGMYFLKAGAEVRKFVKR